MEPEPQPEPVTLLVKSPNQRHRDLELSGDRSWSVSRLKAHLSRVYPERPRPEDQRLIYSGKLLLDHQCLQDLLPKQEKRHVLHLVCNVKNPSKMPETSTKGAESTEQPDNSNQTQHPGDSSSDGLRQREVLRNLSPSGWENISRPEAVQQTFQGLGPGFSGYTTYGWLQLSWFQQIYARQYYMQYLAATAASGTFVPTPSAQEIPVVSTPAPAPIHNQFPAENQPANQNAAAQAVVNPGANQNLRMNAQGTTSGGFRSDRGQFRTSRMMVVLEMLPTRTPTITSREVWTQKWKTPTASPQTAKCWTLSTPAPRL